MVWNTTGWHGLTDVYNGGITALDTSTRKRDGITTFSLALGFHHYDTMMLHLAFGASSFHFRLFLTTAEGWRRITDTVYYVWTMHRFRSWILWRARLKT
jgi:hypothetical protein